MKHMKMLCLTIVMIIAICSPVKADYDTQIGKEMTGQITVGNDVYTTDTRGLFKNNQFIMDLTTLSGSDESVGDIMNTLIVTDLAYDIWDGKNIVYIAGIVFRPSDDEKGTLYTVLLSYIDGDYSNVYTYYKGNSPYAIETIAKQEDIYASKYDFYNYVVQPRVIKSMYHEHSVYLLYEGRTADKTARGIEVTKIDVAKDSNIFYKKDTKYKNQFCVGYDFSKSSAMNINPNFEPNLKEYYIIEHGKDLLYFISNGTPINMLFDMDLSESEHPKLIETKWQNN